MGEYLLEMYVNSLLEKTPFEETHPSFLLEYLEIFVYFLFIFINILFIIKETTLPLWLGFDILAIISCVSYVLICALSFKEFD